MLHDPLSSIPRRLFLKTNWQILLGTAASGSALSLIGCDQAAPDSTAAPDLRLSPRFIVVPWSSGTTDYTTQIRSAIASAGIGGTVQLRSGRTYGYSGPLDLLRGQTFSSTFASNPATLQLLGDRSTQTWGWVSLQEGCILAHLILRGNSDGNAPVGGPDYQPAVAIAGPYATVHNCVISRYFGIGINIFNGPSHVSVQNCTIEYNDAVGIQIIGVSHCTISGNTVIESGFNGIDCNATNASIINNTCENNGRKALPTESDRNGILVVTLGGQAITGTRIIGNYCAGNSRSGIFVSAEGGNINDVVCNGNRALANAEVGIIFQSISGFTLSGAQVSFNEMRNNPYLGFYQIGNGFDSSSCYLTHNTMIGNGNGNYAVSMFYTEDNCTQTYCPNT